jgi:hypothetical protein
MDGSSDSVKLYSQICLNTETKVNSMAVEEISNPFQGATVVILEQ